MALNLTSDFNYETATPSIQVIVHSSETGRTHEIDALIDTGAEGTLLDVSVARALRLNLANAPLQSISGVGGRIVEAKVAWVRLSLLQVPELTATVRVLFAPNVAIQSGNLIGMNVWSLFDLGLSHSVHSGSIGLATS
jgi:predicted aspartyl protease